MIIFPTKLFLSILSFFLQQLQDSPYTSLASKRNSLIVVGTQNVVLSGIGDFCSRRFYHRNIVFIENVSLSSCSDAVSPQGVQSAKNRKASQKDIYSSQRESRKARSKVVAAPVPDIQAQEISRPDYQGWLTKQGGSVKTWKRRWFVLKDYCLYYFKDPVDGNALGCITLPSYSITPTKEVNKKFAFKGIYFFFLFFFLSDF